MVKYLKGYKVLIFAGFWILIALSVIRHNHRKVVETAVKVDLSKDSVIHILTKNSIEYEIRISGKDSLLRFYVNKTQYLEFMLTKRDHQLISIDKEEKKLKLELSNRDKKIDSLINYINSLERVFVPD